MRKEKRKLRKKILRNKQKLRKIAKECLKIVEKKRQKIYENGQKWARKLQFCPYVMANDIV